MHVSSNRLEGSIADVPLTRLLDSCRQHLVTGTIRVVSDLASGAIELRAGVVERARFGRLSGEDAMTRLRELRDGTYRLHQGLPDFDGELGSSAHAWGSLSEMSLNRVMRHCEEHALTCTITVLHGRDRGEVVYRLGDIADVRLNGRTDEDAIVAMTKWTEGRFRMSAEPLHIDIQGWPEVSAEATSPFRMHRRERQRVARGTPTPAGGARRASTHPLSGVSSTTAYFVRPSRMFAVERARVEGVVLPPRGKGRRPPSLRDVTPTIIAELPDEWDLQPPPADEVFGVADDAPILDDSWFVDSLGQDELLESTADDLGPVVAEPVDPSPSGSFSTAPPPRLLSRLPTVSEQSPVSSGFVRGMVVFLSVAVISFAAVWAWLQLQQ